MIITLKYRKPKYILNGKEISFDEYFDLTIEAKESVNIREEITKVSYDAIKFEFVSDKWIKFTNCTEQDLYIRTENEYHGELFEVSHETENKSIYRSV